MRTHSEIITAHTLEPVNSGFLGLSCVLLRGSLLMSYLGVRYLEVPEYFPLPNIRPRLLIIFRTKSPRGQPDFNQVSNFMGVICPMGSPKMTRSQIVFWMLRLLVLKKKPTIEVIYGFGIKKGVANFVWKG